MAYDLTLSGASFANFSASAYGQALTGGYGTVAAANSPLLNASAFHIDALVTTTESGTQVICGQPSVFWLGSIGGTVTARYGNSSQEVTLNGSGSITDGAPHWVRLSLGPAGGVLLVDGAVVGTNSTALATAAPSYTAGRFTVSGLDIPDNGSVMFLFNGAIAEVAIYSTEATSAYVPPTTPTATSAAGLIAVYRLDGDGSGTLPDGSTPGLVTIAPNNPAILYSPYNWLVTSTEAKTINPGAYNSAIFSGASCVMNFNLTGIGNPLPQIRFRVDRGNWQRQEIAAAITVALNSAITANFHLLEFEFVAATETQPRWSNQSTAVRFTGLTLANGAVMRQGTAKPKRVIIFGDSIKEGVRTISATASSNKDTDRNDASVTSGIALRDLLGVEVGIVGFGATGFNTAGSGGVPAIGASWKLLWAGQARDFSTPPDLLIFNEGTNDGGDVTAACTALLNDILATLPTTPILVEQPYNSSHGSELPAARAACSTPGRVTYQPWTGGAIESSDSLHPYGWWNVAIGAPVTAATARPLLYPSGGGDSEVLTILRQIQTTLDA